MPPRFNPWRSRSLLGPAQDRPSLPPVTTIHFLCSRRWIAFYACHFHSYSLGHRGVLANRAFESHPSAI